MNCQGQDAKCSENTTRKHITLFICEKRKRQINVFLQATLEPSSFIAVRWKPCHKYFFQKTNNSNNSASLLLAGRHIYVLHYLYILLPASKVALTRLWKPWWLNGDYQQSQDWQLAWDELEMPEPVEEAWYQLFLSCGCFSCSLILVSLITLSLPSDRLHLYNNKRYPKPDKQNNQIRRLVFIMPCSILC